MAERDAHITKLEGVVRARDEDVLALQATLKRVEFESSTGMPVAMKPSLAEKVRIALQGASKMQADQVCAQPPRSPPAHTHPFCMAFVSHLCPLTSLLRSCFVVLTARALQEYQRPRGRGQQE